MDDKIPALLLSGITHYSTYYRCSIGISGSRWIPYTLIYPEKNLKDEYEKRYRNRGNTEDFLDIFIGQWEFRIEELEQKTSPLAKHIVPGRAVSVRC